MSARDRIDVDYDERGQVIAVRLNGVLVRSPCQIHYTSRSGVHCPAVSMHLNNVEIREYHPLPPHSPWKWLQEFKQKVFNA